MNRSTAAPRYPLSIVALLLTACSHGNAPPAHPGEEDDRPPPPGWLDSQRLSGDMPALPEGVKAEWRAAGQDTVTALYRVCINTSGDVGDVRILQSVHDAGDQAIVSRLYGWTFRPQPAPVCAIVRFTLDTRPDPNVAGDANPREPGDAAPTPAQPLYRNVAPRVLQERKVSGDLPHLPDSAKLELKGQRAVSIYKMCVSPQGTISQVGAIKPVGHGADETIMSTLRSWTYAPAPIGLCSTLELVYQVD